MKTLIIGLGNIGAIHGWALSEAGADITHVVRKGTKYKFQNGVNMDILDLRGDSARKYQTVYLPKLVDELSPGAGYELVMVATNHLQAIGAVRQYCNLVPEASFLMFTANWEGTDEYDRLLLRSRYLWGFSTSTGARGEDGILYANIQKSYRIGELDGSCTQRLELIVALLAKAGMSPDIKADIIKWQWVHHAIDAGMLGTALYKGGLPSPEDDTETWLLMIRAVKDALSVLEKRGVNVRAYEDTKPFLSLGDEEAAANLRHTWLAMPHYQRIRDHSHFKTAPEEMRQFYIDVVTTGEHLGVPMPYLGSFKKKICHGL